MSIGVVICMLVMAAAFALLELVSHWPVRPRPEDYLRADDREWLDGRAPGWDEPLPWRRRGGRR